MSQQRLIVVLWVKLYYVIPSNCTCVLFLLTQQLTCLCGHVLSSMHGEHANIVNLLRLFRTVYIGGALGWMSGVVNLALSWRWTFHILGIAGLVMTPIAIMAVYEPKTVRVARKERMKGKSGYSILVAIIRSSCNPCTCALA